MSLPVLETALPRTPALWLVRHGESTWNIAGLAQGHNDQAELTSAACARRRTPPRSSVTARSARSTPATCAAPGRPPRPSPRARPARLRRRQAARAVARRARGHRARRDRPLGHRPGRRPGGRSGRAAAGGESVRDLYRGPPRSATNWRPRHCATPRRRRGDRRARRHRAGDRRVPARRSRRRDGLGTRSRTPRIVQIPELLPANSRGGDR